MISKNGENGWYKLSEDSGLITGQKQNTATGINFRVYCSHFLSTWGDQMWCFGVGLFLIELSPTSLLLTAVNGLATGMTILLAGALIGTWVDRTHRLTAAQVSLALQNTFVALCACALCIHLSFRDPIVSLWNGWLLMLSYASIIIFAIFADMSSAARILIIERDWVVEICGEDNNRLADMTATLRRMDLAAQILAPIASGEIVYFFKVRNGALIMAAWNVVSMFVEYYLLRKVYNQVSALQKEKYWQKVDATDKSDHKPSLDALKTGEKFKTYAGKNSEFIALRESGFPKTATPTEAKENGHVTINETKNNSRQETSCGCIRTLCSPLILIYTGWKTFMQYNVANAGLGLAMMYLTVLGFDSVTSGYAFTQGISEGLLGLAMGSGAAIGIVGTLVYPVLRHRIGLERTGLVAMTVQIACLFLCVVSVWLPGSPFDPIFFLHHDSPSNVTDDNCTSPTHLTSRNVSGFSYETGDNCTSLTNMTVSGSSGAMTTTTPLVLKSYVSITLLITGIITARFGLWIADLAITQLFLEHVAESERGVVNGVQTSLNRMMDMLKFALVVALPKTDEFGYLVMISFVCICIGDVLYMTYTRSARGHLLPCHSQCGRSEE
ncbi:solute carrier family 40 member 1-like [Haliotis rufescens]|uniref:solute carrier family 40 member 1-like n=1 Tax=Haliotis rufescens TaxID=6454 RepID=UPI00201ED196|nr:solute carrier family 40 member 1-like [Haliotis rufescens]